MKSPAQNRKNETETGKITIDDIRTHLQRFGRDIPCAMPLVSRVEEAKNEEREEAPAMETKEAPKSSGLAPLDTTGLSRALIDRPWDVNSPY